MITASHTCIFVLLLVELSLDLFAQQRCNSALKKIVRGLANIPIRKHRFQEKIVINCRSLRKLLRDLKVAGKCRENARQSAAILNPGGSKVILFQLKLL